MAQTDESEGAGLAGLVSEACLCLADLLHRSSQRLKHRRYLLTWVR
jgi:hypothetical protein